MRRVALALILIAGLGHALAGRAADGLTPGTRVLLDAHNSYPDGELHADRIDRALSTGTPLAIEQDLYWYVDPATGAGRSVVAHGKPLTGREPAMRDYFFERVRPVIEQALRDGKRDEWPVITLNLDFKTDEPDHHKAVWDLLGQYESWLCTAPVGSDPTAVQPLTAGPLLVLTGEQDDQERDFMSYASASGRLRLFGAAHRVAGTPLRKTNYRRWSNNSWSLIEPEGQPKAGAWTLEDERRLTTAVREAHEAGLWIRFYTLDGYDPADTSGGWSASYNFGSIEAVRERWRAAIKAGVDYVAVNQYEEFVRFLRQ